MTNIIEGRINMREWRENRKKLCYNSINISISRESKVEINIYI